MGMRLKELSGLPGLSRGRGVVGGSAPVLIGGVALGSMGNTGTFREGYQMDWGDEFTTLDILGPATPAGKYWTTIPYFAGTRARETQLWPQYEMDPLHTGYEDSNMGVPVGSQNLRASASVLTMQARAATPSELPHLRVGYGDVLASDGVTPVVRKLVAASHSAWGAVAYNPGAPNEGEIILEFRFRYPVDAQDPGGDHPSLWTIQIEPVNQSFSTNQQINLEDGGLTFTNDIPPPSGAPAQVYLPAWSYNSDGGWHTLSYVMRRGDQTSSDKGCDVYFDDVFVSQLQRPYNVANLLTSFILSNHVVNVGYNEANWQASANGFALEVDWVRIWKRPNAKHFKPIKAPVGVNTPFGQGATVNLGSVMEIFGEAVPVENIFFSTVMHEENEPYGSHTTLYGKLPNPSGTINDPVPTITTEAVSIFLPSGVLNKPGRINGTLYAKANGCITEPLRWWVNVGPNISVTALEYEVGVPFSFNLYRGCDCGVLTTDGVTRKKTIAITGLPAWATYNDVTGLITGTPTDTGTSALEVSVTNSLGQNYSAVIPLAKKQTAVNSWAASFNQADGNLEDAGLGITRLDGTAATLRIVNNVLRSYDSSSAGSMYLTPQLTTGNQFIEGNLIGNNDSAICVRVTDRANHFQLRRNSNTLVQLYRVVGGTLTIQASFTLGAAILATDVFRLTDFGGTLGVKMNGVALTPTSGSLTVTTSPPASTREGIVARNSSGTSGFLDNAGGGLE